MRTRTEEREELKDWAEEKVETMDELLGENAEDDRVMEEKELARECAEEMLEED